VKYLTVGSKYPVLRKILNKPDKKLEDLTSLDRVILKGCEEWPLRIQQILHLCKPYRDKFGTRKFATTEQVVEAVKKLVKLELLREVN
jgi:hypothetical protein